MILIVGNYKYDSVVKQLIVDTLKESWGNKQEAAKLMGVSVSTLFHWMKKYKLGKYEKRIR